MYDLAALLNLCKSSALDKNDISCQMLRNSYPNRGMSTINDFIIHFQACDTDLKRTIYSSRNFHNTVLKM